MEHLDVLVVGAGLSGIAAGHYLQTGCPWARYAILEARDAIGGTWDLFRYPGVRSDSDMFTLGYSFRPWQAESSIAEGPAILRYIRETAASESIDRQIRFRQRVVRADWSSDEARWHVTVERTDTGERLALTAGFLFSCSGYYRYDRGYLPAFAGMERFGGRIVHPQAWPDDLDVDGKRVVVIGSGATAVTLLPSLAASAAHVVMLQRSPSYIASIPARAPILGLLRKLMSRERAGAVMRWMLAVGSQLFFQLSQRRPALVKQMLRRGLERRLPAGYDIDTHFTPRYDPWDQRLCAAPDGDFFAAIREGKASVVTDRIARFTENGLRLESGAELAADVIVTATGLEMLFLGGIELTVDGRTIDAPKRLVYKGMMLEGVPNLALAIGYTNASWTLKCELSCEYVCRLLRHLRRTGLRQCMPVNRDPEVSPQPLLGLSAGYIQRAADRFPKQGSRFPWRVYQSYLRDYFALKRSRVDDRVMVFSNPAPREQCSAA